MRRQGGRTPLAFGIDDSSNGKIETEEENL